MSFAVHIILLLDFLYECLGINSSFSRLRQLLFVYLLSSFQKCAAVVFSCMTFVFVTYCLKNPLLR